MSSKTIGVFGSTDNRAGLKIEKLAKTLPQEDIVRVRLSSMAENCMIEMKNGDRYIGVSATQSARGYRWKQVYVPYDVDLDILHDVIIPKIISDLPEHEQIIGYWY
jgi:hypothetical protein